jgi:CheY-like chemotaxis protein
MVTKRILIIDDRKELLHLMRRVLEDELYQVATLQEGREGFMHVKMLLPDLLILDLKLGDISGQDILKQLKNDPVTAGIPVIIYTGAVLEADDVVQLINSDPPFYSGVSLLRKPFDLTTLLDKLEKMLGQSEC